MSVSGAGNQFVQTSAGRKRRDRIMRGALLAGTGLALVPLILVIYYLIYKGVGSWSGSFFTSDPNGNFFGNPGGIRSAIFGTLEIVAVASAIAIPVGIAVALYLTEYGKDGWFASLVRYFVDVMTGVPSVVFGLFIYIVLVVSHAGGSGFAGWKGSLALALLMLPIVIRSSEVVLMLVPGSLREAALALGRPGGGSCGEWCCPRRGRGWSPARCWRSRAAWARRLRSCSPSRWRRRRPRTSTA